MDVEGAEREVLANGSYLDSVQHVIAELHDNLAFRISVLWRPNMGACTASRARNAK
jgi:hypothetical protein